MKQKITYIFILVIIFLLFLATWNQLKTISIAGNDPIYNYNFQEWTNGFVYGGEESPCNFRPGDEACTGGSESEFFGVKTAECKIISM